MFYEFQTAGTLSIFSSIKSSLETGPLWGSHMCGEFLWIAHRNFYSGTKKQIFKNLNNRKLSTSSHSLLSLQCTLDISNIQLIKVFLGLGWHILETIYAATFWKINFVASVGVTTLNEHFQESSRPKSSCWRSILQG